VGRLRIQGRARARQGWTRVRIAGVPVLEAALAGSVAYAIAYYGLGHTHPFFAPVAAWVALGFSRNREPRRVSELAVGVAIGVGAGDLVVHLIGSGWWQMALVLTGSALLARFVDRGAVLTTQAGVQAIVIVGLPNVTGGPFGRWVDALIGGVMALAVTALTPTDVRTRPRSQARASATELAEVLHDLARGLRTGSVAQVTDALLRARASQPTLDELLDSARSGLEIARVSPAARRHREEIRALVETAVQLDRAVRNTRVIARRAETAVAGGALPGVAGLVEQIALAVGELAGALRAGRDPARARQDLLDVAAGLDPHAMAAEGWQGQGLVLLLRSLVVDLLQVAGADGAAARAGLPEL
jgi:uncharacterized membrane protein YgaE (UPF0421/DUF939 family)